MKGLKSDHSSKINDISSGKIISRYVKKNALFAMLFSVLGLWALQLVFAYLAELEDFNDSYTYLDAIQYIFYLSPYFLEQFTPTGALLGAVIGLGLLANNSELIVMRASGLSIYRIVSWVLQPAVIFVLLTLAINQYVLPISNLKANQIREPDTPLLASVDGYWTIQDVSTTAANSRETIAQNSPADTNSHNIVYIDYADANGNIGEVKRWHLDANNNLTAVSRATGGTYLPNTNQKQVDLKLGTDKQQDLLNYQWQLENITTLKLADRAAIIDTQQSVEQSIDEILNNEPLVAKTSETSDIFSLPISPSSVYLLTRRAQDLSLTQLYEHKRFNASQGTRSLEHEVAFWRKLLSPFAILSLVIVACSFVFGSLRTHSLGLRIVVALIFGLLFSYLQDLTTFVSLATGVSPLLMVLLPIIISTLLGLYLIKRQG